MTQRQPEPAWPERHQVGAGAGPLPTIHSLDELAALIDYREDLYLRWSRGPDADRDEESRDALTGTPLPGLSVNTLAVEPWWGDRSLTLWAARRIYDYQHLEGRRPGDYRAWVLKSVDAGPTTSPSWSVSSPSRGSRPRSAKTPGP